MVPHNESRLLAGVQIVCARPSFHLGTQKQPDLNRPKSATHTPLTLTMSWQVYTLWFWFVATSHYYDPMHTY